MLFEEVQKFHLGISGIALAVPPAALVFITCRQVIWGIPWGTPPTSNGNLIFLSVLLVAVFIRLMTVRLVTELRPEALSVAMKGFWRRARIPTAEIRSAMPVTYNPVSEYRGYGVRKGPRGLAYIAHGDQAVQLELRDGRKMLIGSQRPRELADRIRSTR